MAFDGGPMPADVNVPVTGTSIFDPVLCELVYRWFCPPGGTVLDPFAGGSVRGLVASKLGLQYVGLDLSARQCAANEQQAEVICGEADPRPVWIVGDAANLDTLVGDMEADLVFSCPPYGDLEVYSEDPADLSTMDWPDFLRVYRLIIGRAVARLRENRFACFVVGDFRDKQGFYCNFPGETVAAFQDAGARLYNEAVLVTAVGSLPIRVGKQFASGRKLGKTHQNVLVFYKGDPKRIRQEFPQEIEVGEVSGAGDGGDCVVVRVSAAMLRQQFHECEPGYIASVCHGACCQSSGRAGGTLITIHPQEEAAIALRGGVVREGILQPQAGKCPFKQGDGLCGLHGTVDKPFGCIASPFTLNTKGTLIVRNRYRCLRCYKAEPCLPAYKTFRASLNLLFGDAEAERIVAHLEAGGGDLDTQMPSGHYQILRDNDEVKKQAGSGPAPELP